MKVRVMTFNVRLDTEEDRERCGRDCRWARRRDLFAATVLAQRPDLLGLQEVMPNQADDLRASLAEAGYSCHLQPRDGPASEAVGFAVRAPWRVADSGAFWLAVDTPDVPGSKAPESGLPRVATWAVLDRGDDCRILYLNTHFEHTTGEVGESLRVRSAKQIGEFLAQPRWSGLPAVLTLDSNAEPNGPTHRQFCSAGLVDSWAECHPGAEVHRPTTFHLFGGPEFRVPATWAAGCWPGSLGPGGKTCHIDWVLHSKHLRALACEIDQTVGEDGATPSDHFAVVADLVLA